MDLHGIRTLHVRSSYARFWHWRRPGRRCRRRQSAGSRARLAAIAALVATGPASGQRAVWASCTATQGADETAKGAFEQE